MRSRALCLLAVLFILGSLSMAQRVSLMSIDEVKPGLKGIGKTVFEGSQIEEFDVEIMGVLHNTGPNQNLILARLSGEKLKRFGVFAGMSGSPVYIDKRLVGAVAYAFSFATEPIAGITPIQEMVDIFKEHVETSFKIGSNLKPSELYQVASLPPGGSNWWDQSIDVPDLSPSFGQLRPVATPLGFSGFNSATIRTFGQTLNNLGMVPVLGSGSTATQDWGTAPLKPGSTLSVQLVRGDMDVSASGTVTHVSGNKIYAFGHPFLGVGFTELPMSKAAVIGVIPSLMNSQKISSSTESVGTITQDRSTGIMGLAGKKPNLIPVHLKLTTSRSETRELNYEVVSDRFLTPFLLTFTVHNSIISSERSIGAQTLAVKCRIALKGQPEVNFENSISDMASSPTLAALTAAAPVHFILNSGFENVVVEEIDLDITAVEQAREAILDKVWQDKLEVRPGEEIKLTVFLRKANGTVTSHEYPVKIPEGITPGTLKIMVGDGISVTKVDSKTEQGEFIPRNLSQLVRAINNLKKNDRLYIRLFREEKGAVIGGLGMPNLPPSLLALYDSQKTTGDTRPIGHVIFVEHELPPTNFVLTGEKVIQVEVKG